MATKFKDKDFPIGAEFLKFNESIIDRCGELTDEFFKEGGKRLPTTIEKLGTLLSNLYRAATCFWDCSQGDHQIEWFAGRIVNQSLGSFRLVRGAYYDESLMLTRGIGEIANLLCLFRLDSRELTAWKASLPRDRKNNFGPVHVRSKLEQLMKIGPLISQERYRKLCEVGTHPIPGFRPGHFDGDRPKLGGIPQNIGIFVTVNELAYAVAIAAAPLGALLKLGTSRTKSFKAQAIDLMESIGNFDILNYEELLSEAKSTAETAFLPDDTKKEK